MKTTQLLSRVIGWTALGLMLAAPGAAQRDADWQERFGRGPGAAEDWIEFEVVEVAAKDLVVTARNLDGGERLRFKVPPETFVGQRFTADFSGAGAGERVALQGLPESKLENLKVTAPLGSARPGRPGRDGAGEDRPVARRPRQPRRPDSVAGARGRAEYRITAFDPKTMIATAVAESGAEVRLEIHPEAFEGYRFRTRIDQVRKGGSFSLLALNETPLAECCTLLSAPGR